MVVNAAGKYETSRVAVDAVIFTIHEDTLKVFLHTREIEPFKGAMELVGGILREDESAEETLQRKLEDEVGHKNVFTDQFHTFTDPDRDPRARTVSIGFIALVGGDKITHPEDWYPYKKLPQLAFDHKVIVKKAREYLKEYAGTLIARQFMPKSFPLNDLQKVYEVIEDKKYDNRNFRKLMISSGVVTESEDRQKNVAHRPAKLYRFT